MDRVVHQEVVEHQEMQEQMDQVGHQEMQEQMDQVELLGMQVQMDQVDQVGHHLQVKLQVQEVQIMLLNGQVVQILQQVGYMMMGHKFQYIHRLICIYLHPLLI
jgi:hypothetical protein